MRLITGKRTKTSYLILFSSILSLLFLGCKHSIDNDLLGVWQINTITYQEGEISIVPENQKYSIELSKKSSKKIFIIDDVIGTWKIKDSMLIFENIPYSKTHIDSIFVVNNKNGNSFLVLQNGDNKIATIIGGNVIPEKVISKMKIISVNLEELNLLIDKDLYKYDKIN
tara:strand:- start:852 stop:1358 length:507 start_codon:yes stop_codon:yes gene_type:complete